MDENPQAVDDLYSATYEELRRLASRVRRGDPSETLNTTALVNEAYLKLAASPGLKAVSRLHFKRIAARAMRQLLVEAARRRNSAKRGGGEAAFLLSASDAPDVGVSTPDELLALHGALERLERLSPRQATVVESRFFGGL